MDGGETLNGRSRNPSGNRLWHCFFWSWPTADDRAWLNLENLRAATSSKSFQFDCHVRRRLTDLTNWILRSRLRDGRIK